MKISRENLKSAISELITFNAEKKIFQERVVGLEKKLVDYSDRLKEAERAGKQAQKQKALGIDSAEQTITVERNKVIHLKSLIAESRLDVERLEIEIRKMTNSEEVKLKVAVREAKEKLILAGAGQAAAMISKNSKDKISRAWSLRSEIETGLSFKDFLKSCFDQPDSTEIDQVREKFKILEGL